MSDRQQRKGLSIRARFFLYYGLSFGAGLGLLVVLGLVSGMGLGEIRSLTDSAASLASEASRDARSAVMAFEAAPSQCFDGVQRHTDAPRQQLDLVQEDMQLLSTRLAELARRNQALENMLDNTLVVVLALALVGTLLFVLLGHRGLVRPLQELTRIARKIRDGEYQTRAEVGAGEVGELAATLNEMLDRIVGLIRTEEDKHRLEADIAAMVELVSRAAEGDLTVRGEGGVEELRAVSRAFNQMLEHMGGLIHEVRLGAREVADAAGRLEKVAWRMASSAETEKSHIESVSQSSNLLARSIRGVTEQARTASEQSGRAVLSAEKGGRAVGDMVESMNRIRTTVTATSRRIRTLGERSQAISAIVETIEDLTTRTNVLALNASIEVSRPQQGGRGFGMVAEEVRKLAERTGTAAHEVKDFLSSLKTEASSAVAAMYEASEEVEQGVALAREAGAALAEIQATVGEATQGIRAIHEGMRVQEKTTERSIGAVTALIRLTRQLMLGVRATELTVGELAATSETLNETLQRFRIPERVEPVRQVGRSRIGQLIERIRRFTEHDEESLTTGLSSLERAVARLELVSATRQLPDDGGSGDESDTTEG